MLTLRPYQKRTIDMIYSWFGEHQGNPCVVLPTGAGKSVVIAAFCQFALQDWPTTKILMVTHQKELIEQDYSKMKDVWPEADTGIYSAGIGLKQLGRSITFASIQSIYRHASEVGRVNLVIIDEAHLINHEDAGMYRSFITELKQNNEHLKVIGFTATPYRLGHGMLTDHPAIFNKPLIEPVSIRELQDGGYLCRLTSKNTETHLETDGVKITGGDFNGKQLLEAVDVPGKNEAVVREVIRRGQDRKSWLFFCSGVSHAEHIRDLLRSSGITAECVHGSLPADEREKILSDFKAGKVRALTNVNVLTTGFDHPGIDLICMMRPTLSPGLYMQMAGRGLRIAEGKENCLVLDFADNVKTHGPITEVVPPRKAHGRKGPAPCKVCPNCGEIIPMNYRTCPVCMYEYPKAQEMARKYLLSMLDINGEKHSEMEVSAWRWTVGESRAGNRMVTVRYYPKDLGGTPVNEFLMLWHENENIKGRAYNRLNYLARHAGFELWAEFEDIEALCREISFKGKPPKKVVYHKENRYPKVDFCFWEKEKDDAEV